MVLYKHVWKMYLLFFSKLHKLNFKMYPLPKCHRIIPAKTKQKHYNVYNYTPV